MTNCLTTARHDNSIRRTSTDGVSVLAWGVLHVEALPPLLRDEQVPAVHELCGSGRNTVHSPMCQSLSTKSKRSGDITMSK
ncbi:hypothetical protein GCM10025792_13830 [Pseudonocardia tropica]